MNREIEACVYLSAEKNVNPKHNWPLYPYLDVSSPENFT